MFGVDLHCSSIGRWSKYRSTRWFRYDFSVGAEIIDDLLTRMTSCPSWKVPFVACWNSCFVGRLTGTISFGHDENQRATHNASSDCVSRSLPLPLLLALSAWSILAFIRCLVRSSASRAWRERAVAALAVEGGGDRLGNNGGCGSEGEGGFCGAYERWFSH